MVPGVKHCLEALTGKTVVGTGEPATGGLGDDDNTLRVNNAVEFAVVFESGRIFYTGGYESMASLRHDLSPTALDERVEIEGSYHPGNVPWVRTFPLGKVESIIDLRQDQNGDEEAS